MYSPDMLFDIPYIADQSRIGKHRQHQVAQDSTIENKTIINDGIHRKAEDKNIGPYLITEVFSNGTVRIQRGTINERINIRRLSPFFEQ